MNIIDKVKEFNAFKEFNPMQKKVLEKEWESKNLVIGSPTASGKTVIAELCALNSIIKNRRKVIYTCPLRALASEHYNDFKKKYSKGLNVKVTISTGDFDSSSHYLANYDLIYTTYEKLDSLIRHRADWLNYIGLLVVDEIHSIDSDRGPCLEMVITKLRQLNPKLQILALSATIPNADELAKWLDGELVLSDYRPVKLVEGVFFNRIFDYGEGREQIEEEKDEITALIANTLKKKKQALIFANTRRRSESIAKRLVPFVEKNLSQRERKHLERWAVKSLNVLENSTEQCRTISSLIKKGVCFHNAGLMQRQREIIENLFRENYLKAIAATPTLAAGVNLPAFRVIIPSLYRYTAFGNQMIPVREYKQMVGRAGRPKYDSRGEAILFAKSEIEKDELFDFYINGEIEKVNSQLGIEPVLRTHILASIATNFVYDLASIEKFFSKTFYAQQYRDLKELSGKIIEILDELREMGFVEGDEKRIRATKLGNRVSELYLDPISAYNIILALRKNKSNELFYLYAISNTFESRPLVSVPRKKEAELWEMLQEKKNELPVDADKEQFSDPDILKKFNTALMLYSWIDEVSEENILKEFNTRPGILHARLRTADWLVYAGFELARLLGLQEHLAHLSKMRKRLKAGIKEELISLCEARGIGRVRARRLWRSNIRTIAQLKKTDVQDLGKILGEKIAKNVKETLS